jgi:threonine synthase
MQFYSLNKQSVSANFKEATINGQAPDKGLYFPENIPSLPNNWLKNIAQCSNEQIAFDVIKPYVGNCIDENELFEIVSQTINFLMPLKKINESIFSLEMFHGPTLAFKDVGVRFMSRCLQQFVKNETKKITILVATSGDTGGAVANGFFDVDGIEVIILYPSGKVSNVQEQQLTTLGKNIVAVEINGSFDDCQQIVKECFLDNDLNKKLFLTSANSINVARWLPQQFYYFFAYKQWLQNGFTDLIISVPSGNFGNICAGLLAQKSGLPIHHFIAACNANNVVPAYLQTQQYQPQQAIATISNAMDVGDPSNFIRIVQLFGEQFIDLEKAISGYSISDYETKNAIAEVYKNFGYLLDPHGAVAYTALEKYLHNQPSKKGILIETAHPIKFYDVVEPIINQKINLPDSVKKIMSLQKNSIIINGKFNEVKSFLMER